MMIRALKTKAKYILSPKYKYLRRFAVAPGDVVIDLGANVGEVCEYFLAKGAFVFGYEPHPQAFSVLTARVGSHPRMTLYPAAVSNFEGYSKLFLHENHDDSEVMFSQGASLRREKNNVCDDYIEVSIKNIKDILEAHEYIKLLKIDIEGGEYDIIDEVLAQADKIEHILLETHEKKSPAFAQPHQELLCKIDASDFKDKIYLDWF